MRLTTWLLAAVLGVPSAALAQNVIEWSAARRLTRSDFNGRPPASAEHSSLSWLYIDASWECEEGKLEARVRATFDPSRSWWRAPSGNIWESAGERATSATSVHEAARRSAGQRDRQLLEHEQVHFDLAEAAARRIRRRFDDLKGACGEPDGSERLRQTIADIDRELQEEQQRFDRETGHGTNEAVQSRWADRVRKLLR